MAYLALYRRWRPASLDELKGQSHVRGAIKRALQEGKIGHAYLFAGPRGTGKTSTAKILAKALNCLNPKDGEPCGECESCKKIDSNASMDVFEIDAASNRGIDEIRDLRETVKFAPVDGKYKVYIIDEVHMLTTEAFNALLKTLEEPPQFVIFILATTEAHKVPPTIQSRCQRYDFRPITKAEIEERLSFVSKEMKFAVEESALSLIATHAAGGLRDALSLLDQCAAISGGNIKKENVEDILGLIGNESTIELTEAIGERDTKKVLSLIDEIAKKGKELANVIKELSLCLRTVMIYEAAGSVDDSLSLYNVGAEDLEKLKNLFERERIVFALKKLNETAYALKWSNSPRITAEVSLLSLCYGIDDASKAAASNFDEGRIARLEALVRELSQKIQNNPVTSREEKIVEKTVPTVNTAIAPSIDAQTKSETAKIVKPVASKTQDLPKETETKVEKVAKSESVQNTPITETTGTAEKTVILDASIAEGEKVWEGVLSTIEQTGNRNILVCLKQGVCVGINENSIVISFPSPMLASLSARLYKKTIEDALKKVSGKDLTLITEHDAKKKPASKPTNATNATVKPAPVAAPKTSAPNSLLNKTTETEQVESKSAFSNLSAEESANLKKATTVFGDNFIPEPSVDRVKIAVSAKAKISKKNNLPQVEDYLPPTNEYDYADEPDFSDLPPPEDFY